MDYIIDPEIAVRLEEQLLIGEKETMGMNLFRTPPMPTNNCFICLDHLPYLQHDQIMCFICGYHVCRKCHEKDVKMNGRMSCSICKLRVKNPADERKRMKNWIDKGHYDLCIKLGDNHRKGYDGYEGGVAAALYYYLMAAEHGVALAYKTIGDAYGYGERSCGVPKDLEKCIRWLKASAKMGCVEAHQTLMKLSKNSPQVAFNHAAVLARVGNGNAFKFILNCLKERIVERNEEFDDIVSEFRASNLWGSD